MFQKNKIFIALCLILMMGIMLSGCSGPQSDTETINDQGLQIVTSFSIIADIVENVVGHRGTVNYIVPLGDNPEDYELLPSEFQMVHNAHVVFINGLNVEGMIQRVLSNTTDTPIVVLTEGITPIPLVGESAGDPHAWLDAKLMLTYVDNILHAVCQLDPAGTQVYTDNAEAYKKELLALDEWIKEQINNIPQENRVIIVSENAFKYYGQAYGLETEGIWELNSHEEGTPQQMARIIDLIKSKQLPAVFVETTVDKRYMNTIKQETGVPIAGEVYTDALGKMGSGAETYIDMMKYNTKVFVDGLTK